MPVSHAERLCNLDRPGGSLLTFPHLALSVLHLEQPLSCFISFSSTVNLIYCLFVVCLFLKIALRAYLASFNNMVEKIKEKIVREEQINKSLLFYCTVQ